VAAVEYFKVIAWYPLNSKSNLGYLTYMDQTFEKRQRLGYSIAKYHQLEFLGRLSLG